MRHIFSLILLLSSLFRVETAYTGEPEWLLWGDPHTITYDHENHEWINKNPSLEQWRWKGARTGSSLTMPERVPEKKTLRISTRRLPFLRKNGVPESERFILAGAISGKPSKRLVLINVEETLNEKVPGQPAYRCWPHLGMLLLGTVAKEEGYDIVLHDELVEGCLQDMADIVQPDDIIGLSLTTTGIERGIRLAKAARDLGAGMIIAGNDAATFRASQIMSLPEHPVDAIFTTNSLSAVRTFLRQGSVQGIPGVVATAGIENRSNESQVLLNERLARRGNRERDHVFTTPELSLFDAQYWETVWRNYRLTFGHKYANPEIVRNATGLLAQGCTKACTGNACTYCTIADVADIRIPDKAYLRKTIDTYREFGINHLFCATDSLYEMGGIASALEKIGTRFDQGMTMYARSWGIAHHPELLDRWLCIADGRLLLNVGMDSGDERLLAAIGKGENHSGENRRAVEYIAQRGAYLHFSLIFGAPGETRESCERTLSFFDWTRTVLGEQLVQCEPDIFWLNHGSPSSAVFRDYGYAQSLATMAGKYLDVAEWQNRFHRHKDTLSVPWECIKSWYECFTSITVEEAQEYCDTIITATATHRGAAPGRSLAFRPSE